MAGSIEIKDSVPADQKSIKTSDTNTVTSVVMDTTQITKCF